MEERIPTSATVYYGEKMGTTQGYCIIEQWFKMRIVYKTYHLFLLRKEKKMASLAFGKQDVASAAAPVPVSQLSQLMKNAPKQQPYVLLKSPPSSPPLPRAPPPTLNDTTFEEECCMLLSVSTPSTITKPFYEQKKELVAKCMTNSVDDDYLVLRFFVGTDSSSMGQ